MPALASSSATVTASLEQSDISFLTQDTENKVATLTLSASGGDIDVQRITIHFFGTGEKREIRTAKLFSDWGSYIDTAKITEGSLNFTNPGPIALDDGETRQFFLMIELSSSARAGRTLGFELLGETSFHVETQKYDEKLVALGENTKTKTFLILGEEGGTVLLPKFSNPHSSSVASGEDIPLTDFTIRAEGEAPGTLKSLAFHFTGSGISQTIKNVTLLSSQGDEQTTTVSSSGDFVFMLDTPFTPGETLSYTIRGDILDSAPEGTELQLELASFADIIATNSEGKTIVISGEYPMRSEREIVATPSLSVRLADNFSASGSLPKGAGNVPLFALELSSEGEDITVSSVTLAKTGLWEKESVDAFRLQEEGNTETFQGVWKDNRELQFRTSFVVPAGEKRIITIFGDISRETSTNISIGLALESSKNIIATGKSGQEIPVHIPVKTTASKTVGENALHLSIQSFPSTIISETSDNLLAIFSLKNSGDSPIEIQHIRSFISGTSGKGISNIQIVSETGEILSEGKVSGNTILFSNPFPIEPKTTRSLFFRADRNISGTDSFRLGIEESSAISAIDLVSQETVGITGTFPLETQDIDVGLLPEKSTVLVSSVFVPGKTVARGETDVTWGKIRLFATQNNEQVTRLAFLLPEGTEDILENIRLMQGGTSYRGTLKTGLVVFEENIRLQKNQDSEWSLVADIRSGANMGAKFWYTMTNTAQVLAKSNAENIPILGAFPLVGNAFEVGETGNIFCSMVYQPVCGRVYLALPCSSSSECSPENKTFSNSCELTSAGATFISQNSCGSTNSDQTEAFPSPIENADFSDVSDDSNFQEAIASLKENEIVQGFSDGTFRPKDSLGRAALVKIVLGTIENADDFSACVAEEAENGIVFFSDVPENEWFAPYVCEATRKGIINGYPDGTFRPGNDVSFAEAAKIIGIAFGAEFSQDVPWYEPFIQFLGEHNAIPTEIESLSHILTRGEMAEIIWRLRENVSDKESRSAEEILSNE